jgi:hypothetical protein
MKRRRLIPYAGKDGVGGAKDIGPVLLEMKAAYEAAGIDMPHGLEVRERLSARQIAERVGRLPQRHPELTAHLMGDPLPGRSAFDRRAV